MQNPSAVARCRFLIGKWFRRLGRQFARFEELKSCGKQEVDRIAQDAGISLSEHPLGNRKPNGTSLLYCRLKILHVDFDELTNTQLEMLRNLQCLCMRCESRARCTRELADSLKNSAWRHYCPNAGMLLTLPRKIRGYLGLPLPQE